MFRQTPQAVAAAFAVALIVGTVAFIVLARNFPLIAVPENYVGDVIRARLAPPRPQNPDIVVLAIGEGTLSSYACRSPVDRLLIAETLRVLADKGARAVGIDLLFDVPTLPEVDARLRQALLAFPGPAVVAYAGSDAALTEGQLGFQDQFLDGVLKGYANVLPDSDDDTVRMAFPGQVGDDGTWRAGLPFVLAEALGHGVPRVQFPISWRQGPELGMPPFRAFPIERAAQLPRAWLENKIVLIGADLPHDDRRRTPFSRQVAGEGQGFLLGAHGGTIPGVLIHATVLSQLMEGRTQVLSPLLVEIPLGILLALLAIVIATRLLSHVLQSLAVIAVVVILWASAFWMFQRTDILLPMVSATLAFGLAFGATLLYLGQQRRRQIMFVRDAFSRYVSRSVLKRLERDPEALKLGGVKREVSIVFSDLVGFTSFAETQEPTALILVLNEYLDTLSVEVLKLEGTIDKFIGDGMMAVFGAPEEMPDHAERAIACALNLKAAAERYAAKAALNGIALGGTRVGVHSGSVVVGNVGGAQQMSYTAVGDVVNTASRLEGANRYLGTDILISGATIARAGFRAARPIGHLVVKGRREDLEVFEPFTLGPQLDSYNAAYALMAAEDGHALAAFEAHLKQFPKDTLAKLHRDRLAAGETSAHIILEEK
ncbi:CHASE2 domain-containing protein [Zavarzinia sp. CC-PAN008]|uniref:CHASE2 domain-containing protein n=1 Tax=Zavarzinia sp. CC-PAN008 TaxID=3243332 RepID=UPI003F746641